ncbi:tRNA (adenine(37)-N6)-methyltransferase isoform X2 [Lycorma delicatula]|uniref:tRNA (adenine(37)-N6)-methyltransferase isoform X2 n=1 Tax=Lycorma delicatula TaxID=130591 RepID=UPI003F50DE1F
MRQQIKSLSYINQKEIKKVEDALGSWKCKNCQQSNEVRVASNSEKKNEDDEILLQPIGMISTDFNQKRGIPRQPGIGCRIQGRIKLNNKVFTNPEHALEGLEGFSHMWVLFYFHRNGSNHVKAKVSPPRLNGIRTGVFGTRSPHRPCPIGLSLVHISHIDGTSVYFSGVDMLDGTPVLDLKPYIPSYDNPLNQMRSDINRELQEEEATVSSVIPIPLSENRSGQNHGEREAPDGEESGEPISTLPVNLPSEDTSYQIVRVPDWVSDPPVSQLRVTFSANVEEHLEYNTREIIRSILTEDPRSVYLRERYGNQFYTFLIQELHVSCKFDDTLQTVNVYRVAPAEKLCSCGIPEWQCSQHHGE